MFRLAAIAALLLGCGSSGSSDPDGAPGDGDGDGDAAIPFDPGPEPTAPLDPVAGELTVIQLDLPAGVTARLGEAAAIAGPDGTLVLLDVGNSNHDDEVRELVRRLNTDVLTRANGFPEDRGELDVDWVIITHFHGDHVGAFNDLFVAGNEALAVRRGVVHRGIVDLGGGLNAPDLEQFCVAVRGPLIGVDVPLCAAASEAPCAVGGDRAEAVDCPGLIAGDLADPGDDGAGAPAFIDLGGGARLTLVAADGHASSGDDVVATAPFGVDDSNEENARSIAGVISYGSFRYHFGGDMTGSGDPGEPDVESHLAAVSGAAFYGDLGVDVAHVHHHARRTSSNATLVEMVTPADGRSRNAVAGINAAHVGSPHAEVLEAFVAGDRLGDGRFWVTTRAATGADDPALIVADGPVVLQTVQAGRGYWLQAAGADLDSRAYRAVRD